MLDYKSLNKNIGSMTSEWKKVQDGLVFPDQHAYNLLSLEDISIRKMSVENLTVNFL